MMLIAWIAAALVTAEVQASAPTPVPAPPLPADSALAPSGWRALPVRRASDAEEEAAAAWIAAHGHAFPAVGPRPADLAPLVARLAGARVIGIGEASHGNHEDQAFKAELIKALVRGGHIDLLAIECNRDAAAGFDRYVRTGEGDPAALIRSTSFFRIWKGDEFAGLLLWLRAWNLQSDRPVGVVGIDNQDAGRDAVFALADLSRRDRAAAAAIRSELGSLIPADGIGYRHFYRWLSAAPRSEFERAYAALTRLRDRFAADAALRGGDPGFAAARHAATVAWQGFHEFEAENGEVDLRTLPVEYNTRRDRYMAQNLLSLLGDRGRAALWAHDFHILDAIPAGHRAQGVLTVGSEIEDRLGDAYRTVGFTWSRGQVLTTPRAESASSSTMAVVPQDEPVALRNDRPGELGRVFDRAAAARGAAAMWVPIREARGTPALDGWRQSDYWRGHLGWRVDPARWQLPETAEGGMPAGDGYDFLVWFAEVTPQRRWPGLPVAQ